MFNRFETYSVAYYAYFTAKVHQLKKKKKTFGQFEILVLVIMPTRENTRLIARTSLNVEE